MGALLQIMGSDDDHPQRRGFRCVCARPFRGRRCHLRRRHSKSTLAITTSSVSTTPSGAESSTERGSSSLVHQSRQSLVVVVSPVAPAVVLVVAGVVAVLVTLAGSSVVFICWHRRGRGRAAPPRHATAAAVITGRQWIHRDPAEIITTCPTARLTPPNFAALDYSKTNWR